MNSADIDIMDVSRLRFDGDFENQVENLLLHVRLTASEVHNLRYLFRDLEQAFQCFGKDLQVMPFGSIVTGLGIKTSDVDCYVTRPEEIPQSNIVMLARNRLRKFFRIFTNIFAIFSAKVPIVKFLHIPTNCNCDVNFHSPAGVYNSQLVGKLLHMDQSQRALKLAILIKYWAKLHKVSGTNLVSSYTLTLMAIFYLQLMNVLPPVIEMQKSVPPHMIENWNMSFDKNMTSDGVNYDTLYALMGGFFKCYASLKFEENIISPYMGRLLPRKLFTKLDDVPDEFDLYKYNISTKLLKPLRIDTPICIQDPFEHARNSSAAIHPKLAEKIKTLFQFCARKFDEVPSNQFLYTIFTERPPNIVQKFKKIPKHVSQNKISKRNPHQRKHGLQNKHNLVRCYEKLMGNKIPQQK